MAGPKTEPAGRIRFLGTLPPRGQPALRHSGNPANHVTRIEVKGRSSGYSTTIPSWNPAILEKLIRRNPASDSNISIALDHTWIRTIPSSPTSHLKRCNDAPPEVQRPDTSRNLHRWSGQIASFSSTQPPAIEPPACGQRSVNA